MGSVPQRPHRGMGLQSSPAALRDHGTPQPQPLCTATHLSLSYKLNTEMTNAGILYFGNRREQAEHTQPRATKEMGGNGPPDHLVETG